MLIMGLNRPRLLVVKWALAVCVATLVFVMGFERWGAFVGPIGMAAGVMAGWIGLLALPRGWRGGAVPAGHPPFDGTGRTVNSADVSLMRLGNTGTAERSS